MPKISEVVTAAELPDNDIRFAGQVQRLRRFGPHVMSLLDELGAERFLRLVIEQKLDHYLDRLDPELLAAANADRLPLVPIYCIRGS